MRQTARISIGGERVRIVVSNAYGDQPLVVGAVELALARSPAAIVAGSSQTLRFDGQRGTVIPPGAIAISDPLAWPVAPLASLAISLYLPEITPTATLHFDARQTACIAAGDVVSQAELTTETSFTSRLFLSAVWVEAQAAARAVVVLSDSIADGDGSTPDANRRWPDVLAERLLAAGGAPVAVLNQGISGGRVLADGMGVNALARFDRDVLAQPGVDTMILMLGLNDIGWPGGVLAPAAPLPTVAALTGAYRQLIARAHAHGLRAIGATLTPFAGALCDGPFAYFYDPAKEILRSQVNAWIRESGQFDAVIDFDAAVRDPQSPTRLRPEFDSGDHLHLQDRGYAAMAAHVDLALLRGV
ncbi:SGNH/GDSL hydrolase family protein [Rhodoferax sp.]|uniref:SGNH/GDSL hydrolase family protein n=1 Tax=Rhodoferax sp. TaxID=50421 RepID=UPI0025E1D26D|nr:SGNH/GDSL hydrolase family protein [Rhodoferax sp.]